MLNLNPNKEEKSVYQQVGTAWVHAHIQTKA